MKDNSIPANFDWVRERSKCSIHSIFKELELGVRSDIKTRESLLDSGSQVKFSISQNGGDRFSVLRVDNPMTGDSQSVNFVREKTFINVSGDNGEIMFTATLTLNNEGECRLKVGDEELRQWQFRRKALERLFFGT